MENKEFLPINGQEMQGRGWQQVDFVMVSGDAYVDHPSFGAAILGRVLEAEGYKVGILSQPNFETEKSFKEFGKPKYGFFISGGVVDSMVAHYTVAKRHRQKDEYTPGGKMGVRPDRVIEVYSKLAKKAYAGVPVVVGGIEASLRRFAHYDYWKDEVLPSVLYTCGADLISFGMGERSIKQIAKRLADGEEISSIKDVEGTAYLAEFSELPKKYAECASFTKVLNNKESYAKACKIQMDNQDTASALPLVQKQGLAPFCENEGVYVYLVQNIPSQQLSKEEFDAVYELPYTRRWHPIYDGMGGVPALEEVEFSLIHNRGCFGGCAFCAITMHQGRRVASRSEKSVVKEAEKMVQSPNFKGYIHDVGGPTANFRQPSCKQQLEKGVCKGAKRCLAPNPCGNLEVSHEEYLSILRKLRQIKGVKKVFIRSGIRYDYLMCDKDETFFNELVQHHVSGQLKVAPEHCAPNVLKSMGKPSIDVYNRFSKRFYELSAKHGKKQYLVPYLMSSHPGSTLKDAVILAKYLKENKIRPEQVQDFYPTPGTVATCMYYTGIDPYTMKKIFVAKDGEQKALQRALLQAHEPRNAQRVRTALKLCKAESLEPLLLGTRKPQKHGAEQKNVADYVKTPAGNIKRRGGNSKAVPKNKAKHKKGARL